MLMGTETFDTTIRLGMIFHNEIARDPDTGVHIIASRGRSRAGNGHHYTLVVPTCNLDITPRGYVYHEKLYFHFKATNDDEAIAKGNARVIGGVAARAASEWAR